MVTWNRPLIFFLIFLGSSIALVEFDTDSGRRFFVWSLCIGATNPEKCVETEFYGQTVLATFEADCSDLIFKGLCRVVIDVDDGYTLLGITFKAETGIEDMTINGATTLGAQELKAFGEYGKVMNDLLIAFGRLWNAGMGAYMRQLWAEYCDLYISFSGFSMGACLAQMAAVRFKQEQWWPQDQMFYYGFGAPRCGNGDFAYYVEQSLADAYNVNWMSDPFPSYPTTTCTATTAALGTCSSSYSQCCTAVHYTSYSSVALSTYESCPLLCTVSTTVNADHWTYYQTTAADVDSLTCTDTIKFP
ncbi:unnamed protein product [Caenorhabditis angaria]|uniref:Fungal lipase-type domain-containing protein n=1 Tax=Caenorhabditis angaria TaxID=860376 RepID=A0A9P1N873_9PELO|nr:unnamed protein product [Caenorhabditis angaria]